MKPLEPVHVPCRYCGVLVWAQPDDGEPTCADCWRLEFEMLRESFAVEETLRPITEWHFEY